MTWSCPPAATARLGCPGSWPVCGTGSILARVARRGRSGGRRDPGGVGPGGCAPGRGDVGERGRPAGPGAGRAGGPGGGRCGPLVAVAAHSGADRGAAGLVGVVCQATAPSVEHARWLVEDLRAVTGEPVVVIPVGDRPYRVEELRAVLQVPVTVPLAIDRAGVAALYAGRHIAPLPVHDAGPHRRLGPGRLAGPGGGGVRCRVTPSWRGRCRPRWPGS